MELVLAVDISQLMDEEEQQVQRRGYVEAITSTEVMEAIRMGPTGRIAVTYVEWGRDRRAICRGRLAGDRRAGDGGQFRLQDR
ncbi:DUF1194 domain-containing protein [Breoghania sp.]|uniref:DUF1194 domain-containing protein n=1 Tax=Breoghania sp. TaxID=2065378 RepID=UPI002621E4A9|nr:DUF1194 domain-containing protein [Breoghania sp.]MDJ0930000.1 DUF1194 domain-containing protein [Breoghania sp.]